jgi:hypothetical protein
MHACAVGFQCDPAPADLRLVPEAPRGSDEEDGRPHISGKVPRFTARWITKAPVPIIENGTTSMNMTLQL